MVLPRVREGERHKLSGTPGPIALISIKTGFDLRQDSVALPQQGLLDAPKSDAGQR